MAQKNHRPSGAESWAWRRLPEGLRFNILVTLVFVGTLAAWCLTPWIVGWWFHAMPDRGQAGDQFGAVNALFSGLAFAGLFVAILMQRKELQLHRSEIMKSTRSQRESTQILVEQLGIEREHFRKRLTLDVFGRWEASAPEEREDIIEAAARSIADGYGANNDTLSDLLGQLGMRAGWESIVRHTDRLAALQKADVLDVDLLSELIRPDLESCRDLLLRAAAAPVEKLATRRAVQLLALIVRDEEEDGSIERSSQGVP